MQMQIKKKLIFLVCSLFVEQLYGSSPIELSGSIEYFSDSHTKKTIDISCAINANQCEKLLENYLITHNWHLDSQNPDHVKIYPSPSINTALTRVYDASYVYTYARLDNTIANTTYAGTGATVYNVRWHPSGKYILVSGEYQNGVSSQIFALSESGTALYALPGCNQKPANSTVQGCCWHPSGKYYALAPNTSTCSIYVFDEKTLTSFKITETQTPLQHTIRYMGWDKNGNIICSTNKDNYHRVKISLTYNDDVPLMPEANEGAWIHDSGSDAPYVGPYDVSLHPEGTHFFMAVGRPNVSNPFATDYRWLLGVLCRTDDNLTVTRTLYWRLIYTANNLNYQGNGQSYASAWSPDGNWIAFNVYPGEFYGPENYLRIYRYDPSTEDVSATYAISDSAVVGSLAWSPDSKLLSVAWRGTYNGARSTIFSWQDEVLTELPACRGIHASAMYATAFSPDGLFVAYGGDPDSGINLRVYRVTESTAQVSKKAQGMIHQLTATIKQDYQSFLTTETLIYTTSNSLETINPLLISNTYQLINKSYFKPKYSSENFTFFSFHPTDTGIFRTSEHYLTSDNALLNVILPSLSVTSTLNMGSTYVGKALSWNPEGDLFSLQLERDIGSPSVKSRTNQLYHQIGKTSEKNLGTTFYSFHTPAWSPNSSFLLTTTLNAIFNIMSLNSSYGLNTFQTGFSIPDTTTIGRGEWTPDGKAFFTYNSGTGSVGGYFYDFTAETASCSQLFSTAIPSNNISAISIQPSKNQTDNSCLIAVGFNGDAPNLRIYQFNKTSGNTTILPGCSINETDEVRKLAWSNDGKHLAVIWQGTKQYLHIYRLAENSWLSGTGLIIDTNVTTTDTLSWSADNLNIATKISDEYAIFSLKNYFYQTLLKNTSDTAKIPFNTTFMNTASNTLATMYDLVIDNSNAWNALYNLRIETSNSIATHLIGMSNAMQQLERTNSTAIIKYKTLAIATSNSLISANQLNIDNSNAIVTLDQLIKANSNAIAGVLVSTSQAVSELLVATSQANNANVQKLLPLDTIDASLAHVHFNSASITMTYNLNISTDHQLFVHASGVVNGNGHSITFARGAETHFTVDPGITTTFQNVIFKDYNDQAVSLGSGSSLIFGNQSRVELSEPQTLLRTWSFAGYSQLNGLGNALTLGTGPLFLSSLVNSSLQLSNLKLLNVRENNIRAANNNSALNFQDVMLNMSADYTYSVGSITVQNDLTIQGTSTFNYTTIMGCTINPASQLTIDQGMRFNYAPAGNFRNLLSLTDSSAKLFFNNATLIATATGPRLTKGTLLVDGKMNIQSAAASTAQAVIFGDTTPANDLIVTIFPGASINLQTGFLNYANAN